MFHHVISFPENSRIFNFVSTSIIEIIGISDKKEGINNFLHISIDWTEYSNFSYTGILKGKKYWNWLLNELFRSNRNS